MEPSPTCPRALPGGARAALTVVALLSAAMAGCRRGGAEPWLHLAEVYQAEPAEAAAGLHAGTGAPALEADPAGRGWWLEAELEPEGWTPWLLEGSFTAPLPFEALASPEPDGAVYRLDLEGLASREVEWHAAGQEGDMLQSGDFAVAGGTLYLIGEPDSAPPAGRFGALVTRGQRRVGAWQLRVPGLAAEGWMLAPGDRAEVELHLPPDSTLRLSVAGYRPQQPSDGDLDPDPLELTIGLDAEVLWRGPLRDLRDQGGDVVVERLELPLPAGGSSSAKLHFEVTGGFGFAALLAPVVGPRDTDGSAERSTARRGPATLPDIAIFLADTLRSDALEVYAGLPGGPGVQVAPALDRFADQALVFRNAFAPSSWTLPSHVSLFTGLLPEQHGAVGPLSRLSEEVISLPQLLRAAGYRTEAISDGGYVSQDFGLERGFELFLERQWMRDYHLPSLARLCAFTREALDADDGRPLFLFAQTYRAHAPFHATLETRQRLAMLELEELDFVSLAAEEERLAEELAAGAEREPDAAARLAELRSDLQRLYWGGVSDLDAGFGEFLALLKERNFFARGYLFVTSDHGEAFGERDLMYHGTGLNEAQTRVPLLVRGPDTGHRVLHGPVSLTDVAATVAQLADVTLVHPSPARPLLPEPQGRTIHKHLYTGGENHYSSVDWPRRYRFSDSEPGHWFDLEEPFDDRHRQEITGPEDSARLERILREREAWQHAFIASRHTAELSDAARRQLQELGYLGD